MSLQILEPPSKPGALNIRYDPERKGTYARGFLISTKPAGGTMGDYRISRETGHQYVKTFKGKHFIIQPELLKAQRDSHYYDSGLSNLLKGYEANSHGVIEELLGPFYYDDSPQDYWYDFEMRMRDGKASAALQEWGPKLWTHYAVSPHLWDFPELKQDPMNLQKWEGVGVALVLEGYFGPQAVISKLCKGDREACYSAAGLASASGHHCGFNCQCDVCKLEDQKVVDFFTSQGFGSSSDQLSNNLETSKDPSGSPDATKGAPPGSQNPTTNPGQFVIGDKIVSEEMYNLHKEYEAKIAEAEAKGKAAAEAQYKDQNTILINEAKQNTFDKIFAPDIVTDENARKALFSKYNAMELPQLKAIQDAINDYNGHIVPALKAKVKAELEKPDGDNSDTKPDAGNGESESAKKKGKASSSARSIPPETTRKPETNLPSDEKDTEDGGEGEKGKASSKKSSQIQRFRAGFNGGFR